MTHLYYSQLEGGADAGIDHFDELLNMYFNRNKHG